MNANKYILIFLFSITFLLVSCGSSIRTTAINKITEENGAIPPEFGRDTTTVVFLQYRRSYNKYLKRNVRKIYTGNYELVDEKDFLQDEKYKSIEKYRFVFDFEYKEHVRYNSSKMRYQNYRTKLFFVLDRKTNEIYKSPIKASSWSKLQQGYLENLNLKLTTK